MLCSEIFSYIAEHSLLLSVDEPQGRGLAWFQVLVTICQLISDNLWSQVHHDVVKLMFSNGNFPVG